METTEFTQRYVSLHEDEKVLMTLKRRYPSIFSSILSTVGALVILYWWSIAQYIIKYSGFLTEASSTLLYAMIIAITCVFVLMGIVGYFYVNGHLYVLTNKRVIMFRKFITVSVRELTYKEITDIIVNQGPIARWLNYGSVIPLSPGVRGPYALPYPYVRRASYARVELKDISNPMKVAGELFNLARTQSLG